MNDQTAALLQALADKFGTTAEHLWGVLVQQASLLGVLAAAQAAMLFGALSVSIWVVRKYWAQSDTESRFLMVGLLCFFGFIMVMAGMEQLYTAISAFGNPEYTALKFILKGE